MLALAQYGFKEEYLRALAGNELRHPVLASLRVRVKKSIKSEGGSDITTVVVEAEPVSWTDSVEIPSDSINAMHGLLHSTGPPASERLVAAYLEDIKPSPFHNMLVRGEPAEKALALIYFTQRANGAQQGTGFRVQSDNVMTATEHLKADATDVLKYGTIARCTIERCPDYTVAKGSYALAVICRAGEPVKPQHAADLFIETMEPIPKEHADQARKLLENLRDIAAVQSSQHTPSLQAGRVQAFQQRKCRRLSRYPSMKA